MSEVRIRENESLESALKRFKRQCARAGVLAEVRKREHYEKPSVKRKKKAEAARKRKYTIFSNCPPLRRDAGRGPFLPGPRALHAEKCRSFANYSHNYTEKYRILPCAASRILLYYPYQWTERGCHAIRLSTFTAPKRSLPVRP